MATSCKEALIAMIIRNVTDHVNQCENVTVWAIPARHKAMINSVNRIQKRLLLYPITILPSNGRKIRGTKNHDVVSVIAPLDIPIRLKKTIDVIIKIT